RLARRLSEHGIGVESRVALSLDRSPEMLVGLLGILKAGAAYVPIDPDHPAERRAWVLEDAGISAVVTSELHAGAWEGHRALLVDRDALDGDDAPPSVDVSGEALAYVVYTSGTTGRPKGVMVSHASLRNAYAAWELA